MDSEQHWIEKAKQGDQRAFKLLYDSHCERLFRFMKQFSRDTAQVEDWVQRAFIKAYKHMQSFNGTSRFATWLFSIAVNEMKTDTRKPNLVLLNIDDIQGVGELSSADDRFAWHDAMRTLLNTLDDTKRSVFILYEVEGYSHAEIASILHIGENASRTILHRVKQSLRTQWEQLEKSV